jgi:hypothetical protein
MGFPFDPCCSLIKPRHPRLWMLGSPTIYQWRTAHPCLVGFVGDPMPEPAFGRGISLDPKVTPCEAKGLFGIGRDASLRSA